MKVEEDQRLAIDRDMALLRAPSDYVARHVGAGVLNDAQAT
jgi:hypothetical protein